MEIQQFKYDNKIVQKFLYATMLWGVVGMSVGLLLAFMFLFPQPHGRYFVVELWPFATTAHQRGNFCLCR